MLLDLSLFGANGANSSNCAYSYPFFSLPPTEQTFLPSPTLK